MTAPGLVWDACALLNLLATGREEEILASFTCPSLVVREVREGEVFYLRPLPEEGGADDKVPVDLAPLIASGLLQETELDAAERATFVAFATRIDDGEARSAAVATRRGLWLVTDDRPCRNLVGSLPAPLPVLTTPDWVKWWSDASRSTTDVVAETVRRIQCRASFRVQRNHPLREWWNGLLLL
jgi:hypothetical protein